MFASVFLHVSNLFGLKNKLLNDLYFILEFNEALKHRSVCGYSGDVESHFPRTESTRRQTLRRLSQGGDR